MHDASALTPHTLLDNLGVLLAEEDDAVTLLANAAAVMFWSLDRVNWVGFYLLRDGELRLGPFQGKPACTRIPLGSGVCGTAAARGETVVVADVHSFPGHIACDSASRSEIVIPLFVRDTLYGVLDIDSPETNRFSSADTELLRAAGRVVSDALSATPVTRGQGGISA